MDQQYYQQNNDYVEHNLLPSLSHRTSAQYQQLHLKYSYSGMSNASSCGQFILTTTKSFNQYEYKPTFIQAQKLYETIIKMANQLKSTMLIHKDIILYLLYKYKWNQETLNEKYYDNNVGYWEMNEVLQKYEQRDVDQKKGICETCCVEDLNLVKGYFCQHYFCENCWIGYIRENLVNNRIFFNCMCYGCDKGPVLIHFVKKIAPDLVQLYRNKICKNYAIINKSVSYCPSQNCTYFCQKSIMIQQTYIECVCGTTYCFKCEKQPHQPALCTQVQKWQKIINHAKSSEQWIEKYTRRCPLCKQFVEKYIGCNHVKCLCGTEFCFNCLKEWDERHKSTPDLCSSKKSSLVEVQTQEMKDEKEQNNEEPKTNDNSPSSSKKKKEVMSESIDTASLSQLTDKTIFISRCVKRDLQLMKQTEQIVSKYEFFHYLKQMFQQLRVKVHQAWLNLKWSLITLYLRQKPKIEIQLEKDLIQSIKKLMDVVQKIKKKMTYTNFSCLLGADSKQLAHLKEELFSKKEVMNKALIILTEAWRSLIEG